MEIFILLGFIIKLFEGVGTACMNDNYRNDR